MSGPRKRRSKPRGSSYPSALGRVATTLRRLRAVRGWTQEQAAEQCGMATQYLQLVEREGVNVTVSTLARFADGFGVDIAELLAESEPLPPRTVGRPRKVDGAK